MKKFLFGIIGHPIGHTLSPVIHKKLVELANPSLSQEQLDDMFEYSVFDVPPNDLADKFASLTERVGLNVTIPHKIEIGNLLPHLDESSERYGAVNTVDCGSMTGYNTDVYGFNRAIQTLGTDLKGKVLLLGCGGVGRMMALETVWAGGTLTIAVRPDDLSVADSLKSEIFEKTGSKNVTVTTLEKIDSKFDLLINSTPVGMSPNIDDCPVSEEIIAKSKYVFDAIYNPKNTKLIKLAVKNNIPSTSGMSMLVWQAAKAQEIWHKIKYNLEDIEKIIKEMECYCDD